MVTPTAKITKETLGYLGSAQTKTVGLLYVQEMMLYPKWDKHTTTYQTEPQ